MRKITFPTPGPKIIEYTDPPVLSKPELPNEAAELEEKPNPAFHIPSNEANISRLEGVRYQTCFKLYDTIKKRLNYYH